MGMPVANSGPPVVKQKTQAVFPKDKDKNRNSSAPPTTPRQPGVGLVRNTSAPELPPIQIKRTSPSYSPRAEERIDYINDGNNNLTRLLRTSPQSTASTSSSNGGYFKLNGHASISPPNKLKAANGDLSTSQRTSSTSRLATLYEHGVQLDHSLGHNSLFGSPNANGEEALDHTLTTLVLDELNQSSASKSIGQSVDRHTKIRSTETVTSTNKPAASSKGQLVSNKLPNTLTSGIKPQLTANTLSEENLKRLGLSGGSESRQESSDYLYDSDGEKEQRIVQWLIELEESKAEHPPEEVEFQTTEKRDTAIHIVYEGD